MTPTRLRALREITRPDAELQSPFVDLLGSILMEARAARLLCHRELRSTERPDFL